MTVTDRFASSQDQLFKKYIDLSRRCPLKANLGVRHWLSIPLGEEAHGLKRNLPSLPGTPGCPVGRTGNDSCPGKCRNRPRRYGGTRARETSPPRQLDFLL